MGCEPVYPKHVDDLSVAEQIAWWKRQAVKEIRRKNRIQKTCEQLDKKLKEANEELAESKERAKEIMAICTSKPTSRWHDYAAIAALLFVILVLILVPPARGGSRNTKNFSIQANGFDQQETENLAQWSELHKKELQEYWFGQEIEWRITPVASVISRGEHGGSASFNQGPDGASVNMNVGDCPGCGTTTEVDTLRHETNHVVIFQQFAGKTPRWIHEGSSSYVESCGQHEIRRKTLDNVVESNQFIHFRDLVQMSPFEGPQVQPFYAESFSFCEFLIRNKGPRVFAQFAYDSGATSTATALKAHYGYDSLDEAEGHWNYWYQNAGKAHQWCSQGGTGVLAKCWDRPMVRGRGRGTGGPIRPIPPPPGSGDGDGGETLPPPPVVPKAHTHPDILQAISDLSGQLQGLADNDKKMTKLIESNQTLIKNVQLSGTTAITTINARIDKMADESKPVSQHTHPEFSSLENKISSNATQITEILKGTGAITARLTSIESKLNEPPPAGTPVGNWTPIQKKTGISHFVVVVDQEDPNYERLRTWGRRADDETGLEVRFVNVEDMPMQVSVVPQMITYSLTGDPKAIDKGQRAVESALQRIERRDF